MRLFGNWDIRSNSKLRLYEAAANGVNFVSLKSPASLAADFEMILPGTDLANGVMVSDGSGNLSLSLLVNANISGSAAIAYSKLALSNSIVNADIAAAAAIAYSKLALSNSIVNADIAAAAAIAYSKLALTNSIVNADIAAAAAIAYSKLAALTANRALVSDGSGFIAVSAVTATELGYVSGVTSALQTQIDGKVSKSGDTMTGNLIMDNEKEVRFEEATGNGDNYVGLKAPASLAASLSYTLPNAAPASNGYVLAAQTDGTMSWVSNASVTSSKHTWTTAMGASEAFTHSLGTLDVIVQIYDEADGATIEIDSVVRTDVNTVTVTASEAPNATDWRVLILAV